MPLLALALLAAIGLIGFGLAHDAPSEPAAGSPLPVSELADPPPAAVQNWFLQYPAGPRLRPLTDSEVGRVRVTATTARQVALASRGFGYGPDGTLVVWTKVGCTFLGHYKAPEVGTSGYVPPEFPAYVVQVFAAPVPDFPNVNRGWMVVNAETGDLVTSYGGGAVAFGTTCGVSP